MEERTEQSCGCPETGSTCTSVSVQFADVSLPVKVKPYATIGEVETDCCGEPVVTVRQTFGCGCGGGCEITIMQSICIKIPVVYGTTAEAGELAVNCRRSPINGGTLCR